MIEIIIISGAVMTLYKKNKIIIKKNAIIFVYGVLLLLFYV